MNCRKVVREPSGKEDVGDATARGAKPDGQLCEWAPKPIRRQNESLAGYHRSRDGRSSVGLLCEARIQQVRHARLDGEPGERVHRLDRRQSNRPSFHLNPIVSPANLGSQGRGTVRPDLLRDDVAVVYVLDTPVAKAPVVEWYTVGGGKIVRIRSYFDARPFAGPSPTQR